MATAKEEVSGTPHRLEVEGPIRDTDLSDPSHLKFFLSAVTSSSKKVTLVLSDGFCGVTKKSPKSSPKNKKQHNLEITSGGLSFLL